MIPSRSLRLWILKVLLASVLAIFAVLGKSPAWAQGQAPASVPASKLSEADRARQLQERDQMRAAVIKLAQAGKLDEAVRAAAKELEYTRRVLGQLHDDVVRSLQMVGKLQELREEWAAARSALRNVIAIRQRQPDPKEWRIADARRALADLEHRAALDPAQRQRLREADRLDRLQGKLFKEGGYAEGIRLCRKAVEIRGGLLGEDHADYAQSLNNLATLYQAMGEYAKAVPLLRRAEEISRSVLGENHPDHATCLNNLASLYKAMGDYAKAEPLLRRAIAITMSAMADNDSPVFRRDLQWAVRNHTP